MDPSNVVRSLLLSVLVAASTAAAPAFAQVSVNISIAPPAPLYETAPALAPGYVWAPGYWAWHGDRYIWIRGRAVVQRVGYRWAPDHWVQRGSGYYRQPGMWERDTEYRVLKVKKEKKPKHWDNRRNSDGPGHGKPDQPGKGGKHS